MKGMLNYRPPRIALMLLIVAWFLHHFSPEKTLLHLPFQFLGTICTVSGCGIMIFAWLQFHKTGTAICPTAKPTAFVVTGPYRLNRNPMYLGMLLILTGAAFFMGSIAAVFAPCTFFIIMNNIFIPHEEISMEQIFGPEYIRYKKSVRRWI